MMKDKIPNFKRLTQRNSWDKDDVKGIRDIAQRMVDSDATLNIVKAKFGEGKSTSTNSLMDMNDVLMMPAHEQVAEKMEGYKNIQSQLNSYKAKPLWMVGFLRYLGVTQQDDTFTQTQNTPSKSYRIKGKHSIEQVDLEKERKKSYVQNILETAEEYCPKTARHYHNDEPIVQWYSDQFNPTMLDRKPVFTANSMLPVLNQLKKHSSMETLFVDEGAEGEFNEWTLSKLEDEIMKVSKKQFALKQAMGKNFNHQPKEFDCIVDQMDFAMGLLSRSIMNLLVEVYTGFAGMEEGIEIGENADMVTARLSDLVQEETWNRFKRHWDKVNRKPPQGDSMRRKELKGNPSEAEVHKLIKVFELGEKLLKADGMKIWCYRDEDRNPTSIHIVKPLMYDIIEWTDQAFGKPVNPVYVLDASAGEFYWKHIYRRKYPEFVENSYQDRKAHHEFDAKVIARDKSLESIDVTDLETEYKQYGKGDSQSWTKENLDSDRFQNQIVPLINKMGEKKYDGKRKVAVASPKYSENRVNIPELFDEDYVIAKHFSVLEGSNEMRDVDHLFVIGSPRRNKRDLPKEVLKTYREEVEIDDWQDEIKTPYGYQTGYHNKYLDDLWRREVSFTVFEKYFRLRGQYRRSGTKVWRLGINVRDFIKDDKDTEEDLIDDIVDEIGIEATVESVSFCDHLLKYSGVKKNNGEIVYSKKERFINHLWFNADEGEWIPLDEVCDAVGITPQTFKRKSRWNKLPDRNIEYRAGGGKNKSAVRWVE